MIRSHSTYVGRTMARLKFERVQKTKLYSCAQAGASGMRGKLAVYRELQDNMSEGLRFYMSLQEAINTLRQQCGDYCLTRSIQRYVLLLSRPHFGHCHNWLV